MKQLAITLFFGFALAADWLMDTYGPVKFLVIGIAVLSFMGASIFLSEKKKPCSRCNVNKANAKISYNQFTKISNKNQAQRSFYYEHK